MDDPNNVDSYHERWIQRTIRDQRIAEVVAVIRWWEGLSHRRSFVEGTEANEWMLRSAAAYVDARAETPTGSTLAR